MHAPDVQSWTWVVYVKECHIRQELVWQCVYKWEHNLATDYHNSESMFKFLEKDVLVFSIGECVTNKVASSGGG